MYTVQVGQFVLSLKILIYLMSGMAGVLGIRIKMRQCYQL